MIYVENVRFWVPRQAAFGLLQSAQLAWCQGCPAGVGAGDPAAAPPPISPLNLYLVVNNPPLTDALTFDDLELTVPSGGENMTLNEGDAPDYCLGNIEGPGLGGDGEWRLIVDQQIWEYASGTGVSVYGVALTGEAGGSPFLLGYAQLSQGPASFSAVGDIIKISGELILPPVVPPAVEEVEE